MCPNDFTVKCFQVHQSQLTIRGTLKLGNILLVPNIAQMTNSDLYYNLGQISQSA